MIFYPSLWSGWNIIQGRIQGEGAGGVQPPPTPWDDLQFSNTTGILPKKTMWFIGVEVEQKTSAPPPKKNPGSAPVIHVRCAIRDSWVGS